MWCCLFLWDGWVEVLSSLHQRDQRALYAEKRDQLLWKGGFEEGICKYPKAGEGLACVLAGPGSSGA